ncbi:MAG: hypothetical protein U9R15_09125 [Chloroflexota bacterium]|nr:hypothetical protein [Chloroflexota bacterium]
MDEKNVTPKGWKASARRARDGERVTLTTIEGDYWVRPQKLSVEKAGEHRRMIMAAGKHAPLAQAKIAEWKKANSEAEGREPEVTDLQAICTDEEWEKILGMMSIASADNDRMRLLMVYGIVESNLTDEKGNVIAWSDELVEQLMEYEDLAREISGIAQGWNAPLPSGSAGNS